MDENASTEQPASAEVTESSSPQAEEEHQHTDNGVNDNHGHATITDPEQIEDGGENHNHPKTQPNITASDHMEGEHVHQMDQNEPRQVPAPYIDIEAFAAHATTCAGKHVTQIAESNRIKLQELLSHQTILLESLEHENEKFSSSDCFTQMEETMKKCREYHRKLVGMKKNMGEIAVKTSSVKRQCAKLQELKAKSVVANEEARRREIEREKLLVAQPAAAETDGASSPM